MLKQNVLVSTFFLILLAAAGSAAYGQVSEIEDLNPAPVVEGESFRGTAQGFGGELTVDVYIDDGEISTILVTDHSETEDIAEPAFEALADAIVEAQGSDVDVVSGATETSEAFLRAVQDAVEEAEGQ